MAGFRLPMSLKDAAKIYIIFEDANFLLRKSIAYVNFLSSCANI
jgi:hypothetical protein